MDMVFAEVAVAVAMGNSCNIEAILIKATHFFALVRMKNMCIHNAYSLEICSRAKQKDPLLVPSPDRQGKTSI